MGEAKRRAAQGLPPRQKKTERPSAGADTSPRLIPWLPFTRNQADRFVAVSTRGAWIGIAALVIDPFGARAVTSTVANQTQFSFAASAFDVLAAAGANGTGANGVTGSARRSASTVPAGRIAVLSVTPMRDTMPVATSLASVMLGEAIRPQ